jgi:hypothetical protein
MSTNAPRKCPIGLRSVPPPPPPPPAKETITKEFLSNVMTNMLNSFAEETKQKSMEDALYVFLIENEFIEKIKNPVEFDILCVQKFNHIIETAVKETIGCNDKTLCFYTNYSFFENNLSRIFEKLEGSACCCDKAKSLIKKCIDYELTHNDQEFENDKFWIPKKGDFKFWYKVVESLKSLKYGNFEKYIMIMKDIYQLYEN